MQRYQVPLPSYTQSPQNVRYSFQDQGINHSPSNLQFSPIQYNANNYRNSLLPSNIQTINLKQTSFLDPEVDRIVMKYSRTQSSQSQASTIDLNYRQQDSKKHQNYPRGYEQNYTSPIKQTRNNYQIQDSPGRTAKEIYQDFKDDETLFQKSKSPPQQVQQMKQKIKYVQTLENDHHVVLATFCMIGLLIFFLFCKIYF